MYNGLQIPLPIHKVFWAEEPPMGSNYRTLIKHIIQNYYFKFSVCIQTYRYDKIIHK